MEKDDLRLLLPERATRERVRAVFERRGLILRDVVEQGTVQPAQWRWEASDQDDVTYVEDALLRWRYLSLRGPRKDDVAVDLAAEFRPFTRLQLLEMWDSAWRANGLPTDPDVELPPISAPWERSEANIDLLVAAAHALGIGAPSEFDADVAARLAYGLRVPSPLVRLAVLRGIASTRWKLFLDGLSWVAKNDPHPDVRYHAERIALGLASIQ